MFPSKLFVAAVLAWSCLPSIAAAPATQAAPAARAPPAPPVDPGASDDVFLLLREAARQDDAASAANYASRLANYSIASYVDYYRLKPRIKDAAPEENLA